MLLPVQIMPACMIAGSIISAMMYFSKGDYKHTLYWLSSASIIYSVTF